MRIGGLAELRLEGSDGFRMGASGTPSAAAAACRVWSSGVAPTPPKLNTISPDANEARSVRVNASRSSPS
jgi:hypothetical protein